MEHVFKRYAEWATSLRSDVFTRARVKLTMLYMLVMLIVTTIFSVTLYLNLTSDLKESISGNLREDVDRESFIEDKSRDILGILLLVDGGILLVSSVSSYFFAGYTLKPIKSAMDTQEQFTANAAHDLRTPLAVIQTQIEVLLRSKEPLSGKTSQTLKSVLDEAKGLSSVTDDLLVLARAHEQRHDRPVHADTPLKESILEVVTSLTPVALAKDIDLQCEELAACSASMNALDFKRAIGNVIDNAIKYSSPGGTVSITAKRENNDEVTITVADAGQGISEKDLPRVFDRFYKADNARHSSGSGLGLSIVKQLVEQQGGRVTIESVVGQGTTVTIRLKAV